MRTSVYVIMCAYVYVSQFVNINESSHWTTLLDDQSLSEFVTGIVVL